MKDQAPAQDGFKATVAPSSFSGELVHRDFKFDEHDLLLIAMLKDPVLAPEFCWKDTNNTEYAGCYRVRDYQVRFNRIDGNYESFACARSVGKSERQQIWAFTHFFRRVGQNLLITAPELLHLLPLTDKIESRIENTRLTRECLKRDKGNQTGFSHNPFGAEFVDDTRLVGRIPNRDGRGVKAQHQPSLMIEEAQDYPDAGWVEIHETVMKEVPDFEYHIYGVHRGQRGGGFMKRVMGGLFRNNCLTAIMRPGWGADEKQAAIETYGGENAPDYRRNILGEPGSASSPLFVTSRLMATIDQDRTSDYNTREYMAQNLRWEEFEKQFVLPNGQLDPNALSYAIDLPGQRYEYAVAGIDLGLTQSPTVISIFGEKKVKGVDRLALVRRIHLERFSSKHIRAVIRMIFEWNPDIQGIGMDITGLGFPIFQEIQDDETHPDPAILAKVVGKKFNEKIPVGIDPSKVKDGKDPHGRKVNEDNIVRMTVIEATTRYLRQWVDSGYLLLPFDTEITNDLLAENMQRVSSVAGLTGSKKPNAFHILDSFRMASLVAQGYDIGVNEVEREPVLDGVFDPRSAFV